MKGKSLFLKVMAVVVLGIAGLALAISYTVINMSKSVFIETYGKSQEKVFLQIENDLNDFYEKTAKIMRAIEDNWSFRIYLNGESGQSYEDYTMAQKIQNGINDAIPVGMDDVRVLVVGRNEETILSAGSGSGEVLAITAEEIMADKIFSDALAQQVGIQFQYAGSGYTVSTVQEPAIIAAKALRSVADGEAYAVVYVMIRERDFEKMYQYFTSDASTIAVLNGAYEVVSSNEKEKLGNPDIQLGTLLEELDGQEVLRYNAGYDGSSYTMLTKELSYYGFQLCGIIDNDDATARFYNIPQIAALCAVIAGGILVLVFVVIQQTMKPLGVLTRKMSHLREGNFDQYVQLQGGSSEIQALAQTFNKMLDDLNQYVEELMQTQKEKRNAEINALQMQINPHYVFNTLTSIKWLLLQGDEKKSAQALDAFIMLLRNTVYNTEEFVTVKDEIENLKRYVLINQIRYGDAIQVEMFIQPQCEHCRIPKLMIQPFLENAFFHAFSDDEFGSIQVFAGMERGKLRIEITDDGKGMNEEQIAALLNEDNQQKEHFSGIGVANVNNRIKLLYGEEYEIKIKCEEEGGTTVTILLPVS